MGYRWNNFVSNDRLFRETGLSQVTCMIRKRQLWLFGHVVRLPESDSVGRVVSKETIPAWRRPRGRPPCPGCRKLMAIAGSWDYQERHTHSTPLAGTPWSGAEPWPPRRATSACASISCNSSRCAARRNSQWVTVNWLHTPCGMIAKKRWGMITQSSSKQWP